MIDKDGLGKFSLNLFCVGMWIITKVRTGLLKDVPGYIPPSLWNSIAASATSAMAMTTFKSVPIPSYVPPTLSSLIADMTDADRTQYKSFFESLDPSGKGLITGSAFFLYILFL